VLLLLLHRVSFHHALLPCRLPLLQYKI
jgi:hypothetical protein